MRKNGTPIKGFVYAGLMLTPDPMILEYNVRMGDPEAQAVLTRLESDIVPALEACAGGSLSEMPAFKFDKRPAVCLVLASGGYPGSYERGKPITGLDDVEREFPEDEVMVFHAGTKNVGGTIYTNGGRVLGITALGDTLNDAAIKAYEAAAMIYFDGVCCRSDIGINVLQRGKV